MVKLDTVEKINLILKKTNISKVNLAKYLGVSRQMVYNYLDSNDLNKMPADKCQLLFKLLEVKSCEEIVSKELTDDYLQNVSNKIFSYKKSVVKKEEMIELSGLRKDEQTLISDFVFLLKELLTDNKDAENNLTTLKYLYHFTQSIPSTKELKYILGYVAKSGGYVKVNTYDFNEEQQYIFESIMYSAMTLYANGGASKSRLVESHRRWEADLDRKSEEILSRTQELNTAKVLALRELGYTEINEKNASEVFDKIAEIQSRKIN